MEVGYNFINKKEKRGGSRVQGVCQKKEEEGKYRESSSDIVKLDVNEVTYCLLEYLGCSKYGDT